MKRSASIGLLCAVVGVSLLPAQRIPTWPRPLPSFSDLLTERVRVNVAPSYALQTSSAPRSAVDALLTFGADTGSAIVPQLTLDLTGARTRRAGYTRSGVGARFRVRSLRFSPWGGGAIGVGSGAGPARVLQLHGGLGGNALNLEVRTTWLTDPSSGRDSATSIPRREFVLFDSSYTDVELNGNRRLGRFDFDLVSGARFGASQGQRQWLFGVISTPLFSRIGIAFSGGWRPALPERAQRGGRFAMVSLLYRATHRQTQESVPSAPSVLQAVSMGKGRYLLSLSQAKARSVRIKSDLTNWDAVALRRAESDVWQIELTATEGIYKINLSIDDGPWLVPAGLLAVPDGFGGSAGVLNLN